MTVLIRRYDVRGNFGGNTGTKHTEKFVNYHILLRRRKFRSHHNVGQHNDFCRIERSVYNVIVVIFLFIRQNFISAPVNQNIPFRIKAVRI